MTVISALALPSILRWVRSSASDRTWLGLWTLCGRRNRSHRRCPAWSFPRVDHFLQWAPRQDFSDELSAVFHLWKPYAVVMYTSGSPFTVSVPLVGPPRHELAFFLHRCSHVQKSGNIQLNSAWPRTACSRLSGGGELLLAAQHAQAGQRPCLVPRSDQVRSAAA